MDALSRRAFAKLSVVTAASAVVHEQSDALTSEFLLTLTIAADRPHDVGPAGTPRQVVPVSSGTFEGPRLKGTIIGPAGDWITERSDGSRVLDVRLLFQTDDGQAIYVSWRGIAYTQPDGRLFARILPLFETAASKYAWLNNVVAVGVYQPRSGKIVYRVHRIL